MARPAGARTERTAEVVEFRVLSRAPRRHALRGLERRPGVALETVVHGGLRRIEPAHP